jgi:hypothetical protein
MDIIKQKIREQLEKEQVRTTYLTESLKPLSDISDEGFFIQSYIQIADTLMNEGYTLSEIEPLIEQSMADRLKQGVGGMAADTWDKTSVLGALFGGGLSGVKEQIVKWLLTSLGMGAGAATFISTVLADYDVRDLLKVFKSKEHCLAPEGLPGISDAVMEGIVAYLQTGEQPMNIKQDIGGVALRNVFADVMRQSNLGEGIAEKVCGAIWKN